MNLKSAKVKSKEVPWNFTGTRLISENVSPILNSSGNCEGVISNWRSIAVHTDDPGQINLGCLADWDLYLRGELSWRNTNLNQFMLLCYDGNSTKDYNK